MSKYGNKKTEIDGIIFHSKAEANRYLDLKCLERAGKIKNLVLQPRYDYKLNGKLIFFYKADFKYFDVDLNREVIEDVKSKMTAKLSTYRLKKKLIEVNHNIQITEVF